ncbi:hypothetical protein [uncultured Tenacibaculum sp.]|uniref:hypothetical protein n=1 Tax=uncultured Tenacibaculum sp. TaxID=174713 RepID=UPI00262AF1DC|nr:hypothetical protein [uncultured Tenacibaculum sp.]
MKQNKETLKQFFETGDKPTQQQYADLIDSYIDAKQPEGEANRRFVIDELGEVSVASKQKEVQADFNQTDNNQPDFIKGYPLTVFDYEDTEKFKTKTIKFGKYFDFDEIEKKILLKIDSLKSIVKKNTTFSLGVSETTTTTNGTGYSVTESKYFDSDYFDESTTKKWYDVKLLVRNQMIDGAINGVITGTVSPSKVKSEVYLEIMSSHNFFPSEKLLKVAEIELNDQNLIESIRESKTPFYIDYAISTEKGSYGSWTPDLVYVKAFKKVNNQVSHNSIYKQLRHDNHPNNNIYSNLSDVDFRYKVVNTVEFSDEANTNGNNKKYTFNSVLVNSFIEVV